MRYMTTRELAKRAGISPQAVRWACSTGKLAGAKKIKGAWQIPWPVAIRRIRHSQEWHRYPFWLEMVRAICLNSPEDKFINHELRNDARIKTPRRRES